MRFIFTGCDLSVMTDSSTLFTYLSLMSKVYQIFFLLEPQKSNFFNDKHFNNFSVLRPHQLQFSCRLMTLGFYHFGDVETATCDKNTSGHDNLKQFVNNVQISIIIIYGKKYFLGQCSNILICAKEYRFLSLFIFNFNPSISTIIVFSSLI